MTFKEGLLRARHHIVFMCAVACAFGTVWYLENVDTTFEEKLSFEENPDIPTVDYEPLTPEEKEWAKIAWIYFENNYIEQTGLVNSADKYPASTMWDTASYLMALISAYKLDVIDDAKFHDRTSKALKSLAKLPLYENQLPNKSYNTYSLGMVDYNNNDTDVGIGWSALDIGRLMVPFNILVWNYPQFTSDVNSVVAAWKWDSMLVNGYMMGAAVEDGATVLVQEGRIGYEEYAAKAMSMMGKDLSGALIYEDFLQYEVIGGQEIPTDSRDPSVYTAHNYVVSESYVLDGIEFGWDRLSREFAYRVYKAQENRYLETGELTAVSEDNIDEAPYFVYNTVFTSGKEWNTITEHGEDASEFRTVSTKAAFGWHMLYRTDYTQKLMETVTQLYDPERGFYSGLYLETGEPNKAITANSNGIILESLHYKAFGPFLDLASSVTAPATGETVQVSKEASATKPDQEIASKKTESERIERLST